MTILLYLRGIPLLVPLSLVKVKEKVKQSLYRPGRDFEVPGRSLSKNF
jgi:hypothetical protein